jgi:hypothetical protein
MKAIQHALLGIVFFTTALTQAQVSVSVNIGTPPVWAPAPVEARYYYLPDIATYYDINTAQYVYVSDNRWVRTRALPPAYRNYDLYNCPRVVVNNYRGNAPYVYHTTYVKRYPSHYRGAHYAYAARPQAHYHRAPQHHGNGHGRGHGNGNSHHGRH